MTRIRRATSAAVMVCVIATHCGTLFASDEQHAAPPAPSHLTFNGEPLATLGVLDADRVPLWTGSVPLASADSSVLSQPGGFRRGGRGGRNSAAATALFLGAIGTIAGSAILIYANRPECSVSAQNSGCGYGSKVAGGAVLTGGLAGLLIGAVMWR
jgi:hypothetical protein